MPIDSSAIFGSLRDVPVAAPRMRPTIVNFIVQGSAENFQKKTKKYINAYSRARFGSLRDVPVAAARVRVNVVNYIFSVVRRKFPKNAKKYKCL